MDRLREWARSAWVCGVVCVVAGAANARIIEVEPDKTIGVIGQALSGAVSGDIIRIGCGLYREGSLTVPPGVSLEGIGSDGCAVIEGDGTAPVLVLVGAGPDTRIWNLVVTTDPATADPAVAGAGMLLDRSSPDVMNVTFRDLSGSYGGAVFCGGSSAPVFHACTFEDNSALAAGGAVACADGAAPVFDGCLMAGNTTGGSGGAINVALGASATLTACTIVGSGASLGGALASFQAGAVSLDRVLIADGLGGGSWVGDSGVAASVGCTDIHGNAGGDWIGPIAAELGAAGNIAADPLFCGAGNPAEPFSLSEGSPCLAADSACGMDIGAFGQGCEGVAHTPETVPAVSRISGGFPNPFNPSATVVFELRAAGPVQLSVFDVSGRLVRRLVDEHRAAGVHDALWEGRDGDGRQAAAGVYFFRLKTPDTIDTRRMTLVK